MNDELRLFRTSNYAILVASVAGWSGCDNDPASIELSLFLVPTKASLAVRVKGGGFCEPPLSLKNPTAVNEASNKLSGSRFAALHQDGEPTVSVRTTNRGN